MRRKISLSFILVMFGLLLSFSSLKANSNYVESKDGVSIRMKTESSEQGLRFYAKLNESVKDNEHGFYLVFGNTTISELKSVISNGSMMINGKEVFRVIVPGITENNEFSVVLTGIPDYGYFETLTAIAFVDVDGEEKFVNDILSNSVADIALKMANDGMEIADIVSVSSIVDTDKRKVYVNASGDVEISRGVYELDYKALKEEFIKDWNLNFGLAMKDLNINNFFASASAGSNDSVNTNVNLTNTNMYKFFGSHANKWGWLLEYLADQCNIVHVKRQADAISGDGTNNNFNLFNGVHFAYSLVNFFNNDNEQGDYMAIDFKDVTRYDAVKYYNDGVYVVSDNYKFYNDGDLLTLPAPKVREGYAFNNYRVGSSTYSPGQAIVVGDFDVVVAEYNLVSYPVKFYDGNNVINDLSRTYNVEDSFNLPSASKPGYVFLGWYNSPGLGGNKVTKLEKGNVGEIKYYASWQFVPTPVDYTITYNLNGGSLPSGAVSTYDINTETFSLPVPSKAGNNFLGWFLNAEFSGSSLSEIEKGSIGNKNLFAKWESAEAEVPEEYTITFNLNGGAISGVAPTSYNVNTADITLPSANRNGYNFLGWYLNSDFSGSVATKINKGSVGNIAFYAKWEQIQVDPATEYTITFNLNGGAWPTETIGGTGYTNRDTMIKDFLTDFYNFLKPAGLSLNDFMHGPGKTSGFDGKYPDYVADLRELNVKTVNPGTGKFVNQEAYNKWVPLIDLMDEYTGINAEQKGQFWSSDWVAGTRFKPFVLKQNLWGANGEAAGYAEIAGRIPAALASGGGGTPVQIEVPSKFKVDTNDITLPSPTKAGDNFVGWYDNADYQGNPVTKIVKGTTGNKVFYARYTSTVVPEKPLTDAEKMTAAKNALAVGYSSGDSASSVKGKLTLPTTGIHGATVTWATSNAAVVTATGAVTQSKEADVTVTLTATIKLAGLTETKVFSLTVKKEEPKPTTFTITYNLNGGSFDGYKNKTEILNAFFGDLYTFVQPGENLNTFVHGSGKTSGFDGLWFSNDDYKAKIYAAGTKTGNNAYFASSSTYQAKWKPFFDFMETFVKVGNPDQDFWASPYTGNIRLRQYAVGEKPSGAWSDEDMAKIPTGMSANVAYEYDANSPTINLPAVKRASYSFEGWYDNAAFTGNKVTSIPAGSSGNKVFYAKWSQPMYTITLNLNGGSISKFTKAQLKDAFLNDLYSFIGPSDSLATFKGGTWFSNEDYKNKIYGANIKTGNNNYFFSSSQYQAKWKPLTDFMENFVKVGNPEQNFWASPYTGIIRLEQYLNNKAPSSAWSASDMSATPAAITPKQFSGGSQAIILPNASRSGHTFNGWYTANTGGTKVTQIAANATGNQTLYARWTVANVAIGQTKTLTGTDLWNMRETATNLSLSGGGLKATSTTAKAVYQSKAMDINTFNQLVMSWNVSSIGSSETKFMVSIGTASSMSAFMTMGFWKSGNHRSNAAQSNTFASVSVDTLTNKSTANRKVKVRFEVTPGGSTPTIKNVSLTTKPTSGTKVSAATTTLATKTLNVPLREQMNVPTIGNVICSPTSMAMILLYYGKSVTPKGVADQVYDRRWKAYGNWTLNASYAGSHGLNGRVEFVTSFTTIGNYIKAGIPLALSIKTTSTSQLTNSPMAYPSGHLVVIVGFVQRSGVWYAVMNDPAVYSQAAVRREYRVSQLAAVMSGYTYVVTTGNLS